MRKPHFLFPKEPPIAPEFNPAGDIPAPKIPGTPTAQTGVPAASRTGAQRLALSHRFSRARLRFRAEPGLSRSSGCGDRPGGLGPAPPRAAGLRVGRRRGPGGSARTRPRHPRRRVQVGGAPWVSRPEAECGRDPQLFWERSRFRHPSRLPGHCAPLPPRLGCSQVFFSFFPRRFSITPSLCGTRPPPTPRGELERSAGPGGSGRAPSGWGPRREAAPPPAGAGGALDVRSGEGAARALRASPSAGAKLLKLQKRAGAGPPAANKTKQNAAKGKAKWRC